MANSVAHAQTGSPPPACGELRNHYGPYDYRTDKNKLGIVEGAHFTTVVEAGIRGNTSRLPGPDLNYTLTAFPNHHRALLAMANLGEKTKSKQPEGAQYTVECYFDRALRFRRDDVVARMLYVQYLIKNGRQSDATTQLGYAETTAPDNALSQYTIGLLYFDMKNYESALTQAHKAAKMGFEGTGLRDLLTQAGHWKEPAALADAPANTQVPAAPADERKP